MTRPDRPWALTVSAGVLAALWLAVLVLAGCGGSSPIDAASSSWSAPGGTAPYIPTTSVPSRTQVTLTLPDPPASSVQPSGACRSGQVCASSWPAPDNRLTPGATEARCTVPPGAARNVTATTEHLVAGEYGIDYRTFKGEYDHRIPRFLCGDSSPANIWPELRDDLHPSGFVLNEKDKLEAEIARRVHTGMPVQQAQAVFYLDWRHEWCLYIRSPGVICDV